MSKTASLFRTAITAAILLAAFFAARPVDASAQSPATSARGDFFIITSVNLRMHELFLKAPTEVTELMLVNEKTVFLDQQGKQLAFKDLRAGDTVYVESNRSSTNSEAVAIRIQLGPMTPAILHSRYLK